MLECITSQVPEVGGVEGPGQGVGHHSLHREGYSEHVVSLSNQVLGRGNQYIA